MVGLTQIRRDGPSQERRAAMIKPILGISAALVL
jgi:hypothetical protein